MSTHIPADGAEKIQKGQTALGIECGSTRVKAVLIDDLGRILATGAHDWENELSDELWSYPESAIWTAVQGAYSAMAADVMDQFGVPLTTLGALGFSAMMHGYLAMGADRNLLVPFRTWRNVNTAIATEVLSVALDFNMPHRWSSAHFFQAALDREEHVNDVKMMTTLSGYIHMKVTGQFVLGVGDAAGMFPVDPKTNDYDSDRLRRFDSLTTEQGVSASLRSLLPKVLVAGQNAGSLTAEGALLLDPSGTLQPGAPTCPPEGDAGTGMVATNCVLPKTGNVSAGTSIFGMVVLDKELARVHPELDMVATPDGEPVAMVHANNGTSEWDQWVGVFAELLHAVGTEYPKHKLYDLLYDQALKGDPAGGDLIAYNFLSGEPVLDLDAGRPLFYREPGTAISLPNFLRTQLMTIFGTLRVGIDILAEDEGIQIDRLFAHGGLFKSPLVSQKVMAGALRVPVEVASTAGEGGPWGMALLALYAKNYADKKSLAEFLDEHIFVNVESHSVEPDPADVEGFDVFFERYLRALPVSAAAAEYSYRAP